MTRFSDLRRREDGMALVVAVLIGMAVMMLAVLALNVVNHDTKQSASNRRRLESITAAEAGIDRSFAAIQTATPTTLVCERNGTMPGAASARYTANITYYDANGTVVPCANPSAVMPAKALIRSTGSTTPSQPTRTMESLVNLQAIRGGALSDVAIFSQGNVALASNLLINGALAPNADIYTNGNLTSASGDVIQGNIFAQGSITLSGTGGGAEFRRDVWANGPVVVGTPVRGNARSSTSSVAVNARIDGDATAGTTISPWPNPDVGGRATPNSPSAAPPVRPFPAFTFDAQSWIEQGYTVNNFTDCTLARNFVQSIATAGKRVVRVTTTCAFTLTAPTTVRGNLAILANGSITLNSNTGFRSDGAQPNYDMFLFSGLGGSCASGVGDFELRSNANFGAGLKAVIRTPCAVRLNSNGHILDGQIFGGSITFASNTTMTYYTVYVPGSVVTGFKEDIVYTREVR